MSWLKQRTREKFEALADPLLTENVSLSSLIPHPLWSQDERKNPRILGYIKERIISADQWTRGDGADELPSLQEAFESEVERVVSGHYKWQKLFGG